MTSTGRYSAGAMILHWAIAIAVIANWQIAEKAEHMPEAERLDVMVWHFSLGMTILLLTLLRIVWRLTHKVPSRAHLKWWERALASTVHTLFYVLLIVMPLLGWIGLSGYEYAVSWFGLFEWPVLPVGFGEDAGEDILEFHAALGTAMLALIALHVLGALKHTVIERDGTLWKMLPFGRVRTAETELP